MWNELLNVTKYFSGATVGYSGAVTLGNTARGGGMRGYGHTSSSNFDYLSTAENTYDCFYQKLEDLKYYESHDITEKVIGLYRDYINQLWKEGSTIIDIPDIDDKIVDDLNAELEGMNILEILTKDLDSMIFYGSVTYELTPSKEWEKEISEGKERHGIRKDEEEDKRDPLADTPLDEAIKGTDRMSPTDDHYTARDMNYVAVGPYKLEPARESMYAKDQEEEEEETEEERKKRKKKDSLKRRQEGEEGQEGEDQEGEDQEGEDQEGEGQEETDEQREQREEEEKEEEEKEKDQVESILGTYDPRAKRLVDKYSPSRLGKGQSKRRRDAKRRSPDGNAGATDKLVTMKGRATKEPKFVLNKVRYPHNTIIEYSQKEGRRYLVKAANMYHIPSNRDQVFYYGNDSMKLAEKSEMARKNSYMSSDLATLIGYKHGNANTLDRDQKPKKYDLLERELSASVPLFYHHIPKVRELYLKGLVLNILGIKDVIQPDILAMNFEAGMDVDRAQEMCNNMEDLLNKNADYTMFNSSILNYNDLVKLLIDTVRILPDIDGKIQQLNPIRTTSLQEKIMQLRNEYQELVRALITDLGIPYDLYEGNASKWEVIKRAERLQSKVAYHINTIKMSLRRLTQSLAARIHNIELKPSDIKIMIFNKSDLEIAQEASRLQSVAELSQMILQIAGGAERELVESKLVNKEAFFTLLQSLLLEIYPEADDLLNVEAAIKSPPPMMQQY